MTDTCAVMNAAGTAKTPDQARALLNVPGRALLLGSFTPMERPGNPGRVDYFVPWFGLNVRGIPSPPMAIWSGWVAALRPLATDRGRELWVSVAGFTPDDFAVGTAAALDAGADKVELNFGCPNMQEGQRFAPIISYRPALVEACLSAVDNRLGQGGLRRRVGVKVSPIFDQELMAGLAGTLRDVAFVTSMNTLPYGSAYTDQGNPVISFGAGLAGVSGPSVKPVGVGQIAQWRALLPDAMLYGVGGIETARDVFEYQAAGATYCQVATAIVRDGPDVMSTIAVPWVSAS